MLVLVLVGVLAADGLVDWAPGLAVLLVVLVPLAQWEFYRLVSAGGTPARPVWGVVGGLAVLGAVWAQRFGVAGWPMPGWHWPLVVWALWGVVLLLVETAAFRSPGGHIARVAAGWLGILYVPVLASFIVRIRFLPDGVGPAAVALLIAVVKGADSGAYLVGRAVGRHKLAPHLSPGKTVEGALGGLVCAVALGAIVVAADGWLTGRQLLSWPAVVVFGLVVGVVGQAGDLVESMMKRDAGLKDSGDALPGHGGILDRIDSYLFTPAVVFYAVTLVLPVLQ